MVVARIGFAAVLVAALLLPAVQAQPPPEFLLLGEDATGDAQTNGVPMLDTWVDINHLAVATIGTDLVFHLGLQGTTTEVGQYCWMAAFEFDGTEYVGLDCYEGVAYEDDNTLSGVVAPDTSRGENVASSVAFDATGAVITIPLDAIGAGPGSVIEDIYGLTYATRGLVTVDAVPDAKRTASADESLGSYCIGGCADAPAVVQQTLNGTSVAHDFANTTSATYELNLTVPWANATVALAASAGNGTANVTVLRGNETLLSVLVTNATGNTTRDVADAAGNWTLRIVYDGFVGSLAVNVTEAAVNAPSNGTGTRTGSATRTGTTTTAGNGSVAPAGNDAEDVPGLAVPLVAALLAVAAVAARRRT